MPRKKNRKIGDRVFFDCYNGTISSTVITNITDESYIEDGKTYNYKMYETGPTSAIEDYNCLPDTDPRVIEYKKKNKDVFNLEKKIRNLLNKYSGQDIDKQIVANMLYELSNEFEQ